MSEVTFANSMGQWLAPLLLAIRSTSFFEWWVFVPAMTLLAIPVYRGFHRRLVRHGGVLGPGRFLRPATSALHAGVCVVGTNAVAVAFKTLIVQEMDYPQPVWFAGLVSPLHFYIASVAATYMWMVTGPSVSRGRRAQGLYTELGLFAFCTVAIHRLHTEPFSIWEPTMALGGLIILVSCLACMADVWQRLAGTRQTAH